jgi:hypothetical protein
MKTIYLNSDIIIFCVTADSFPDGVPHAWHQLHKRLDGRNRACYGISYMAEDGTIVYKAGAKERAVGEAERYGCERFVIPKGHYLSETILHFSMQLHQISRTFQTLLAHPGRAAGAVCIEWYQKEDVVCMVKEMENCKMENGERIY